MIDVSLRLYVHSYLGNASERKEVRKLDKPNSLSFSREVNEDNMLYRNIPGELMDDAVLLVSMQMLRAISTHLWS